MIVVLVLLACAFILGVIAWIQVDRRRDQQADLLMAASLIQRDDPR